LRGESAFVQFEPRGSFGEAFGDRNSGAEEFREALSIEEGSFDITGANRSELNFAVAIEE
jgi:hypothetical protein